MVSLFTAGCRSASRFRRLLHSLDWLAAHDPARIGGPGVTFSFPSEGRPMPKGEQRSNKMVKKPKKDTSPPKESTSDRPMPPTTTIVPTRGKLKNK
jgi:hypothetical protein